MKIVLIFFSLFFISCNKTKQSYESLEYKEYCNKLCQKERNTNVDWVGSIDGSCYCK